MSHGTSLSSVKPNVSSNVTSANPGFTFPAPRQSNLVPASVCYGHGSSSSSSRPHSSESSNCQCCHHGVSGATDRKDYQPTGSKKLTLVDEFKSWNGTPNGGVSGEESDDIDCIAEEEEDDDDVELDVGVEGASAWTLPSLHLPRTGSTSYGSRQPETARPVAPSVLLSGVPQPAVTHQRVAPIRTGRGSPIHITKRVDLSSSASATLTRTADKTTYTPSPSRSVKFIWLFNIVSRLLRPFARRSYDHHEDFTSTAQNFNRPLRETKPKPPAVCALPKVPNTTDFSIGRVKKKEECSRSTRVKKRRRRRRHTDLEFRNVFVNLETQNHVRRIMGAIRKHVCRRRKDQDKEPKSNDACAVSSQTVSSDSARSPSMTNAKDTASIRSIEHKTRTIAKLWKRAASIAFAKKLFFSASPRPESSAETARLSDSEPALEHEKAQYPRSGYESPSSCDVPHSFHVHPQRTSSGTSAKELLTTVTDVNVLDSCWASWAVEDSSAEVNEAENPPYGPVTICTSSCRYEVVRRVSRRLGIKDVAEDEPWNLYWTDLSISPERCKEMKRFQKINHFPGMAEICRKDLLARNLNRMYRLFPKDYNFFPKTWCLPADLGDLCAYARTKRNRTYILKPDTGCQGKGIYLTRNVRDLKPHTRMICQAYIAKPFLVDGYKFDMRVYTLVTSCDPLRVFVYKDGLVRFCTIPYHEPNAQNTNNVFMHLTNYAVNKHSRMYVVDDEAGSKRKISTLNKWLESKNFNVEEIWERIDELIVKTLIAALPVLRHNYHACFPSHDFTFACFELLGFDILLDHKLKPFILEVNHSPSFHTDAQIDKDVKESLLHDTFEILNLSQYDKKKVIEEDRKRVRDRLLQKIHRDLSSINSASKENLNKAAGTIKKGRRFLSSSESSLSTGNKGPDSSNLGRTPSDGSLSLNDNNPWRLQFAWEDNNLGNYRRVYPLPGGEPDKYESFFHQNLSSLFQETAASRAREEASRQQRDLYESPLIEVEIHEQPAPVVKQKEEEARRVSSGNVSVPKSRKDYERIRPESPTGQPRKTLCPLLPRVKKNFSVGLPVASKKQQTASKTPSNSFIPGVILESEEKARISALAKRSLLVHSQGIVKLVYDMLKRNKSLCAEDLRKYAALDVPGRNPHRDLNKPASDNICLDGTALFQAHTKLPSLLSLIQKTAGNNNTDSGNRKTVEPAFGLEVTCGRSLFRLGPDW